MTRTVKLVVLLTLAILLAVFVLQNQAVWHVRFLWFRGDVPAAMLSFLTVAAGFIVGVTTALLVRRGARSRRQETSLRAEEERTDMPR